MSSSVDTTGGTDISAFNGPFLGYLIFCGVLSIFFALYLNRLFASVVSWGIRTWTWHRYRVFIDIQALQVSLLGGRVFFTGLRYHGNNETILIQNGHITWSYWLRRVRDVELSKREPQSKDEAKSGPERASRLPCRINVSLVGLEWFVYNRSPVYDSVLAGLSEEVGDDEARSDSPGEHDSSPSKLRRRNQDGYRGGSSSEQKLSDDKEELSPANSEHKDNGFAPRQVVSPRSSGSNNDKGGTVESQNHGDDLPLFLQLYPIYLECGKAAMVLGNENTSAVLIINTESFTGEIDASKSETPDLYRQTFRLRFKHPVIEMKDNHDYKEDLPDRATREKLATQASAPPHPRSFFRRHRRKAVAQLRNLIPYWRKSVESFSIGSTSKPGTAGGQVPGFKHWQGLSRYLGDDGEDQKARWASVEYASLTTILDSPEAFMTVFWDVPGKVGAARDSPKASSESFLSNINGGKPPAWTITLSIKGGSVNYGPWADRHRAELQRTFFPTLCKDAVPAKRLLIGADRVPTQFKLYVELEEDATVRIPIREDSKNWKWKGKEPGPRQDRAIDKRKSRARSKKSEQSSQVHQRPYGWLDIKIPGNTTVSYSMDMVAAQTGYTNSLQLDMPKTEISSSINHELLWRSGPQRISCDLSTPLRWNALRQWHFSVTSEDLELFLLRDHIFLLIDLVDDWAAGPPAEYLVFTPFRYLLDLQLRNLKLYLNVNDANIINNPTDMDDNTYLVIGSPELRATTCIPIEHYRPNKNSIPFDVEGRFVSVSLHVPPWNTQATLLSSTDIGHLENLNVGGSYNYNATNSPANTDTLILNVTAQSPQATIHGFVVRYFLKLKDNYFGDDVHFKTLEEYQEILRFKAANPSAELPNTPPRKVSNDLDVILNLRADDPRALLPGNLYSAKRQIQVDTTCFNCDLRFTNYYMDMDLLLPPLSLSLGSLQGEAGTPMSATASAQLFVDGIHIYGHRLFGLPPTEPTYLCNWDISIGALSGECSPEFLTTLISGAKALAFSFDDDENALIPYSSIIFYDITFLRAYVQSVNIWLRLEDAAFQLCVGTIDVNYNDWARSHYSKRADIKIPLIRLCCVDSYSAIRNKARTGESVDTNALIQTSLHAAIVGRKFDFEGEKRLQQELVRREDQRTHRTEFLCLPGLLADMVSENVDPPAQCFPRVPAPIKSDYLLRDEASRASTGSSKVVKEIGRKSSFLSLSSSSQASVVRPLSSRRSSLRQHRADGLQPLAPIHRRVSQSSRSSLHARDVSASPGPRSAFHSTAGEFSSANHTAHNTVAFSSQFLAPYFPLQTVVPDLREATMQSIEIDWDDHDLTESMDFDLDDVDPEVLSDNAAHSSILIELPTGLTAFLKPTSVRHIASLITALQPSEPEDILDTLQLDAMTEIFSLQKEQKMKGHVKDISLRIPRANVRVINDSKSESADPLEEAQDQFDFAITKMALALRSETTWQDAFKLETRQTRTSFHFRLRSGDLAVAERMSDMADSQRAISAQVEDVMVSMGSKDLTYLDADIGNIQGNVASTKIKYIASLIRRTNLLVMDTARVFDEATAQKRQLVRYISHRLITERQEPPDPVFLVRPSAVLRSARQHLRTFDSWKLVMHLRQMWTTMNLNDKDQLKLDCMKCPPNLKGNLREEAVASFQQWRSWDLEDVSESVLLNQMFGRSETHGQTSLDDSHFLAVLKVKAARLALQPGPKHNEISIMDFTCRLDIGTPTKPTAADPIAESGIPLTNVNVCCGDISVILNWDLCELASDLLVLYENQQPAPKNLSTDIDPDSRPTLGKEQAVHCVISITRGSVVLETVNLEIATWGQGLTTSILSKMGTDTLSDVNLILSCDTVTSRLRHHSQGLLKVLLHKPSVFASHRLQTTAAINSHTIRATASSQDLRVVVKEDPIALSEVVNSVVSDEIAWLYRLKQQLPSQPSPSSPSRTITDRLSTIDVNVAMFLEQYTIRVPLLRSIAYTVSGTVSRAAMAANFGRELIFDFDINDNYHEMEVTVNNVPRSISLLQIPPMNGRISSQMGHEQHSITVFASLELVQFDASAVYSLLSALNRPEISSSVNDLKQQIQVIQEGITNVFGSHEDPGDHSAGEQQGSAAYSIHLTLAGLEVFGNSPLKSHDSPIARISFCLDSVHVGMSNRRDPEGCVLAYPEVHVNLQRIHFEIQKGSFEALDSCGNVTFGALLTVTSSPAEEGGEKLYLNFKSDAFEVNLSPDTVSTVLDVLGHMGDKIKDLDTSKELEYLRKIRQSRPRIRINDQEEEQEADIIDTFLRSVTYSFEVCDIRVSWLVAGPHAEPVPDKDDLILSLERIEFCTRIRNSARLTIEKLQLQMAPPRQDRKLRSANSALLPEVIFNVAYVSTSGARRLAFQAVGKSLDLRLNSGFIIPAVHLNDSITLSVRNAQQASQNWNGVMPKIASSTTTQDPGQSQQRSVLGKKRLESLLVDADFAGAVVYLSSTKSTADLKSAERNGRPSEPGKYGQFAQDESGSTVLRTPGLAWKIEYRDNGKDDPSLYAEVKVDASSNILYPSVVPLIMDMSNSVKEVVRSDNDNEDGEISVQRQRVTPKHKAADDDINLLTADPSTVLGRLKLNLGLRIYKQEFSLSCQPIARVAATASFEDVYFTFNTVHSVEQGNFFAMSGAFTNLRASVQHVYSRESTGSFDVESIVFSLMNSKHISGISGLTAILKVSPMKVSVNAKQLQDFLLFREIWVPHEIRRGSSAPVAKLGTETSQGHLVQRYQQVAATAAFPWTATVSISSLEISVDLGQALGKSIFAISDFWISSKKTSDWEQNLCLGFRNVGVESTGRMSGFVNLKNFQLRTSIRWPEREQALNETPAIQASIGFGQFKLKAAFDYQAFLIADVTSMEFLMYNVRRSLDGAGDRLVAIFDGDAVQVFGTTTSTAQAVALYQAFQRLVQERKASFEGSLREIERFRKRRSLSTVVVPQRPIPARRSEDFDPLKSTISLDTDVVVTLRALNLGAFPSTFSDHQVFKMEALNAQARFAASMEHRRIHSILGLTLGQLRIGLAGVRTPVPLKALKELSVEEVVLSATGSRGGTILKVPRVEAVMQTWQAPRSRQIDYIFKSAFEGKVEVGWNYSRISYIRGMWASHAKNLAQVWGRELPSVTAIRVTGVPEAEGEGKGREREEERTKITAEVNVPQSKYEYTALEPPIIETPQLRDMGEATPPLEWIGLHRERLPNLTHQIVIVSLLELAGEVEDAYTRILGSS